MSLRKIICSYLSLKTFVVVLVASNILCVQQISTLAKSWFCPSWTPWRDLEPHPCCTLHASCLIWVLLKLSISQLLCCWCCCFSVANFGFDFFQVSSFSSFSISVFHSHLCIRHLSSLWHFLLFSPIMALSDYYSVYTVNYKRWEGNIYSAVSL